jgi:hypothetical protein
MDKARYVMSRLKDSDYDTVHVYEDNAQNIRAIEKVVTKAGVKFNSTRVMAESLENFRSLIREQLLAEDPMGFVQQLAGPEEEDFFGGNIDKKRGREIKQAFEKHADHQWLSTIDTVHWGSSPYGLRDLVGKGRDELSTTMALPSDPLRTISISPFGLWIKGRITLASDTQDSIYSGFYDDYGPNKSDGDEEAVAHRDKSSGRNKRPTMSKRWKGYANLERGNEYMEKMARNIPYVLDQSTWNPNNPGSTNEALVDNWSPVGIVVATGDVESAIIAVADKMSSEEASGDTAKDINHFATGVIQEAMLVALELGVPIYYMDRNELWSPGEESLDEAIIKRLIREAEDPGANSGGDCYEAAGKYMMDKCMFGDDCSLILVHGEVAGQGVLEGVTFGHAWVLDGGTAIDRSNGGNLQLPQTIYYAVGQIDQIGNTHEYTWEQARKMITDSEHWGPWDLATESGL